MKQRTSVVLATLIAAVTLACSLTGGTASDEPLEATEPAPTAAEIEVPTSTSEPTATSVHEEETTTVRALDGMEMVPIPAGEFLMGDDAAAAAPERPEHLVYLDSYWIDRLEVSNAQYRQCVEAGTCAEPNAWRDPNFNGDEQPAIVPWEGADAYCAWVGARLPTEAEWEKAARGTDGRTWPWGNEFEENWANISGEGDGYGFTAPVGSFPGDMSPYGVLDVAGNAAEWVADWWDEAYYARSPQRNPSGPNHGELRIHRAPIANAGGGPVKCRCTVRYGADPNWEYGFRCASGTPPDGAVEPLPAAGSTRTAPSEDMASADEETPSTPDATSAEEGGDWPRLESYRIRTVMTLPEEDAPEDIDGPIEQVFVFEWDAAAPAGRMVVGPTEEITIGDTRWTRLKEGPWQEKVLTVEEQAEWEQKWSFAQFWGDPDLVQEELEAALPDDVDLVPAQIFPVAIKAAMVFDGEEAVNGVHCRRYTVDTDLDYTQDLPGGGETHTTGHATGTIWVADQEGIPPVIVRALMNEDLVIDGDPSHPSWEHNTDAINQPIVIEPPE